MDLLRCPKCKLTMRYQAMRGTNLRAKKKVCVYCGRSFSVTQNKLKSQPANKGYTGFK